MVVTLLDFLVVFGGKMLINMSSWGSEAEQHSNGCKEFRFGWAFFLCCL